VSYDQALSVYEIFPAFRRHGRWAYANGPAFCLPASLKLEEDTPELAALIREGRRSRHTPRRKGGVRKRPGCFDGQSAAPRYLISARGVAQVYRSTDKPMSKGFYEYDLLFLLQQP
jgi:hypothetical protein